MMTICTVAQMYLAMYNATPATPDNAAKLKEGYEFLQKQCEVLKKEESKKK